MTDEKKTITVVLSMVVYNQLKEMKIVPEESFDHVIARILKDIRENHLMVDSKSIDDFIANLPYNPEKNPEKE